MRRLILCGLALSLVACGDDEERQEVISKLRGIGAAVSPLVSLASTPGEAPRQAEVTVYAALPAGQTATIEPYIDKSSAFAVTLATDEIVVKPETIVYKDYPGFQLLTFKAALTVPPVTYYAKTAGAGQARYGFLVKAGDEEEKLVGNFLIYPEGAPELAWTNPEIAVLSPADGSVLPSGNDADIAAALKDKNDEELKLGWFASGGEIRNRRAKETVWETPEPGPQSLIFTAHGKKSRGFALQILTVTTQ